ncbi:Sodium-coupled monocarboxylate transporter 1 [Armadillidium vulgare]|nr:Sodium-coupled monocarboxylate transporter 1 [Armadillidium vulgare]
MTDLSPSKFGVLDYCMFAGVLIISGVIGLYTSYKGNKSPEEFLMGNRSFKPLPVTLSLLTSFVSATSLLGFSGEAYAYGMQMSLFVFGTALAIKFSSYFILPVIYPLNLTSINEYIELRFNSKRLGLVIASFNLAKVLISSGGLLFAPTIALAHVTNLSVLTNIFLLGSVCTLYSSFGGIRAVIWTDVFQFAVTMIGLILVAIAGCIHVGGFFKVFYISSEGGRLDVFNMNPSPFVRQSFFNVIAFGFFFYMYCYSSHQITVQRICTVASIKHAKRVLDYNIYGMFVIYFFIFTGGLIAYSSYAGCDPLALGIIKRKEEIMTHFIGDKLGFIPGLPGVFVAVIIGSALSSLSSVINGCVAMIWRDFFLRFSLFQNASTGLSTLSNKILCKYSLTLFNIEKRIENGRLLYFYELLLFVNIFKAFIVGALIIALAVIASHAVSILEYQLSIMTSLSGPF